MTLYSLLEDDEDDIPGNPSSPPTAFDILPLVLFEDATTQDQVDRIGQQGSLCLVVEAPSAEWVAPTAALIRRMGDWDTEMTKVRAERARTSDDDTLSRLIKRLARGERVFAVAPQLELLPHALRTAADITVMLGRPSSASIGRAIELLTGVRPAPLDDAIVAALGFDQIASALRIGSTPQQCVDRLLRTVGDRKSKDALVAGVPELTDLHGYGEAMTWANQLLNDLGEWRRGAIPFSEIQNTVVLASEPGLGKTTFVRSLSRTSGLPLIATSVGQWFAQSPGYLDSIIKEIDSIFAQAKSMSPALLFIDEIDGIPNRANLGSRNSDWWAPVVAHLLTRLDGAVSSITDGLIVIGATNLPDRLDPALTRPGRMSRIVTIERPTTSDVLGILRQHLAGDLAGEDLAMVAEFATGSTGAELAQIVKTARARARMQKRPLAIDDLLDVVAPPEDRTTEHVRRAAVHEAGHAVVGAHVGHGSVESITIVPRGIAGGCTLFRGRLMAPTKGHLERYIIQTLAGRAAEELLLGEAGTGSGGDDYSDLARATSKLGVLHLGLGLGDALIYRGDEASVPRLLNLDPKASAKVEHDMQRYYAEAKRIVLEQRELIDAVADELVERRQIGGQRFQEIVGTFEMNAAKAGGASAT